MRDQNKRVFRAKIASRELLGDLQRFRFVPSLFPHLLHVGENRVGLFGLLQRFAFLNRMSLGLGVTSYGLTSYESLFFNRDQQIEVYKYRIGLRNAGFKVK